MCLLDSMSSRVAVGSCGSYLVFLIAQRDVEFGLLSLKLKAIRDCLNPSFEQLDAALAADDVQQKAGECPASSMPLFSTVNFILESNSEMLLFVVSLCVLFQSEHARVHPAFCACQCLSPSPPRSCSRPATQRLRLVTFSRTRQYRNSLCEHSRTQCPCRGPMSSCVLVLC